MRTACRTRGCLFFATTVIPAHGGHGSPCTDRGSVRSVWSGSDRRKSRRRESSRGSGYHPIRQSSPAPSMGSLPGCGLGGSGQ